MTNKLEQAARQAFETWWESEGQEFLYALNTTTDDDIKLVAEIAWKNGAYCAKQAEQEPVATHICNLWVDPITKEYVVDHCDHPIEELIPAYSTSQYLSKKPDYWLGYGLQAYTQKPFEGATPLYAAPVRTKDLTDDEIDILAFKHGCSVETIRAVIAADREKNK